MEPGQGGRGGWWRWLRQRFLAGAPRFDCLQVEVSSRCFAGCRYCPHGQTAAGPGTDMGMEVFSRLTPLFAHARRVHLQGWGEPFLNRHFFAMAKIARDAGCRVSTTSCGLTMSEGLAEEIVDAGLDVVALSLAGTDEASNGRWRGVSFSRVRQAMATLSEAKRRRGTNEPQLHLAYLLLPDNAESLAGLPPLLAELGIAAAVVSTLDYLPHPALHNQTFDALDPHLIEEMAALLARTAGEAERIGSQLYYHFPRARGEGRGCLENCGRSLFIAADGAMSPCVFTNAPGAADDPRRRVFGNVTTMEPLAIWQSPAYVAFRRDLAEGRPQAPCLGCRKRFGDPC